MMSEQATCLRAASVRSARITAWWLDVRQFSLIRVNAGTTWSDDHWLAAGWLAGSGTATTLRSTAAGSQTTESSVSQVGNAHGGEHSTTELDPSHRTTSPSLGNLKTNESSLTHSRSSRQALEPQAVHQSFGFCEPPATRVAVRPAVKKPWLDRLSLSDSFSDQNHKIYAAACCRLQPPSSPRCDLLIQSR